MATVNVLRTAICLSLAVSGCASNTSSPLVPLLPRERALIDWWLVCIECTAALDSIKALGLRNSAAVIDALNAALLKGPTPASITSAESALVTSFIRDSTFRARTGLGLIPFRSAYVAENRDRYRNGYQIRGAIGLGWIGTPAAKTRLDSAAVQPLPVVVKTAVIYARDSLP